MADARNLIAKPAREPVAYEAHFKGAVNGPDDDAFVIVPSYSRTHLFGPCIWEPRISLFGDVVLPSEGDLALVVISNEGRSWIVSWTPYE